MADDGGCLPAYSGAGTPPTLSVAVEGGWTTGGGVGGKRENKTRMGEKWSRVC